ncbi:MAG: hypothetical protein J6A54_03820 [Clostridia bacterium]|nr:hypothetical protein [Clostridia bacterium]
MVGVDKTGESYYEKAEQILQELSTGLDEGKRRLLNELEEYMLDASSAYHEAYFGLGFSLGVQLALGELEAKKRLLKPLFCL